MSELIRHVKVRAGQCKYTVTIGSAAIQTLGDIIKEAGLRSRVHVVADQRVWELHSPAISNCLTAAAIQFSLSIIPVGEASKTVSGLSSVLDNLAAAEHERGDAIVAVGGGVTTDLAGFAAAIWHRGVPWICCPTSLEAAIDAGIGGKTAVNLPAGKNLIGAFHHPVAVVVDLDLLATLPQRDYVAALAESVKHAVVARSDFLDWQRNHAAAILNREPGVLAQLIETNVAIKADVIAADERETAAVGVGRAALNLGHTVGHALEATRGFDLRHGEAVALGLRAGLALAVAEVGFSVEEQSAVNALLDDFGLPRRAPAPFVPADILERMRLDKKARGGHVRFVLPRRLGDPVWWTADNTASIEQALAGINSPPG